MEPITRPDDIIEGDFLSEVQYYKVIGKEPGRIKVENERGFQFAISDGIVAEGIYTANQFNNTVEVTRTELIERFSKCGDTVMTVNYRVMPKPEDINDAIESANKGKFLPIADLKKVVKDAYKGRERTLIGYLIKVETGFGRSMVIDLQADRSKTTAEWDSRIRQVDHRTLNWLIQKNIKYIVK